MVKKVPVEDSDYIDQIFEDFIMCAISEMLEADKK